MGNVDRGVTLQGATPGTQKAIFFVLGPLLEAMGGKEPSSGSSGGRTEEGEISLV